MTAGPRGPTEGPLDLRAIQETLDWHDAPPEMGEVVQTSTEHELTITQLRLLLAHVRALRAALKKHGSHSRGCPARFTGIGEWYARPECTCGVAAVLALARDEEAPRKAEPQPE